MSFMKEDSVFQTETQNIVDIDYSLSVLFFGPLFFSHSGVCYTYIRN